MDKLKEYIDKNRLDFEDIELPVGHSGRFNEKLNKQKKRIMIQRFVLVAAVAACLGILFVVQIQYQKTNASVCELSNEIKEVRMYYNMQFSATLAQMEELYKQNQTPGSLELMKQTQEVIAVNQDFETKILPTLPCSEEALYAMSQHYDASISGMNILLRQMQKAVKEEDINN